jgi:hypothetical protein
MNRSQIFAQYENTDAELIALDVIEGNIIAYRADFNSFSEMVLDDGRVIRQIERPGGSKTYSLIQNFVGDEDGKNAYMDESGEWTEQATEGQIIDVINWIAAVEA